MSVVNFLKYPAKAFMNHWNLLVFAGGMGFAALSGHFDVFGSLVLAAETAYLGLIGTHPKFQKYVDAQEAKQNRQSGSAVVEANAERILSALPKPLVDRFKSLRDRCNELRQIAEQIRESHRSDGGAPLDQLQIAGLDRLLWIYLRLLFTQSSLVKFLQKTSVKQIQTDITGLEGRIKPLASAAEGTRDQRLRKVLEENLATSRTRLANYEKAQENAELMTLEIERLENTIQSLSELAINRQEPDFITEQINTVSDSMVQTEKTMGELQFVTGLNAQDDEQVPSLLRAGQKQTAD